MRPRNVVLLAAGFALALAFVVGVSIREARR